jgi:hypothetical protein
VQLVRADVAGAVRVARQEGTAEISLGLGPT